MSNSAYLKTDTRGGETKFFPQRTSRNFSKTSNSADTDSYRLQQRTDIPNSSPAEAIQLTPNDDKKLQRKEDIRSKQQGAAVQKKDDNSIKGEIGLHEGTATKNNGAVTVDGKTKDGEDIRGAHYNTEAQYDKSEAQITEMKKYASKHAFFEFVAHFLAYKEPGYVPPPNIQAILDAAGYQFGYIKRGNLGFQYVYLQSLSKSKNNIVAFRGTNPGIRPSDIATIYADTDPRAVGMQQYDSNRATIESLFANGNLDIAGHSLGGAVAQIVACNYTSQVGNIYTYQSPGIDAASVAKFNKVSADKKPNVHHHIAVGDLVDKAGEQNIPGNVYTHDFGIYWMKTQELLKTSGTKIANVSKHILGVAAEANSIGSRFHVAGFLDALNPYAYIEKAKGLMQDVTDIQNHIATSKAEAKSLIDLYGKIGEAVGEAHLKFLFSSGNFEADRGAGLDNSFYKSSKPNSGPGMKTSNESSVVTASDSYPFQDERKSAETIRDIVGTGINAVIDPFTVILISEGINIMMRTLDALHKAAKRIIEIISETVSNMWDAITGFPDRIEQAIAEFCYQSEQLIKSFYNIPF